MKIPKLKEMNFVENSLLIICHGNIVNLQGKIIIQMISKYVLSSRLQIEKFCINITEYLHRYKWILDSNLRWKTKEVCHIQGNLKSIIRDYQDLI